MQFIITHDEDREDIVTKISEHLRSFGLYINRLDDGYGFIGYEIRKTKSLNDERIT